MENHNEGKNVEDKQMKNISLRNWIIFFIISCPFIDIANGILKFSFSYNGTSPGQILRSLFFIINVLILIKIDFNRFKKLFIIMFIMGISIVMNIFNGQLAAFRDIFNEVLFDVKFLYVISILLLLISAVKLKKISVEDIESAAANSIFIIALSLILTSLLNIGFSSYGQAGNRGFFTEINALTAALLIGLGIQFNIYIRNMKSIFNFIKLAVIFAGLIGIGTKSSLVFALVLVMYNFLKIIISSKNKIVWIISGILMVLMGSALIIYFKYGNGNDILLRLKYFYSRMNLWSFLVSGRDEILYVAFSAWSKSIYYIIFGIGYYTGNDVIWNFIEKHGSIEMDFFDTYYFFGSIIGTITLVIFTIMLIRCLIAMVTKNNRNYRGYALTYIVAYMCTMLGGHVLFSPLAGMYFAVIYILNKEYIKPGFKKAIGNNERKIKVLHVGPSLKEQGGVVTVINSILNLDMKENVEFNTLSTFTNNKKMKAFIKSILKYLKICIFNKPDIIHIHMASGGSFYRKSIFVLISRLFNVKIIVHLHGARFREFYSAMNGIVKRYCRYIMNKTDKLIILTEEWRKFAEVIVKDKRKIALVSNFVQVPEKIKRNTKNEEVKILFLGRLGKRKGTYLLIKAAKIIKEKNIKFKMILAGDGEIDKCKKRISDSNLENEIEVLGWIDSEEREKYLRECDILALPSYFESFGMSLIEGMSYSMPVIATKAGAMPYVVENEKDGILIKPGNYEELAEVLIELIENRSLRIKMGNRGYEHVQREFSDKVALGKFSKIYRELSS